MSIQSLYDRINAWEFKSKLPFPGKGSPGYVVKMEKYRKDSYRLEELFWDAVREELDLTKGDPFADELLSIAWDHGHSGGYSNVVSNLEDMMPLWEMYQAKGNK